MLVRWHARWQIAVHGCAGAKHQQRCLPHGMLLVLVGGDVLATHM